MAIAFPYKSRQKFSESDGINSDNTYLVDCEAIAKSASDVSPYLIANELIAGGIAQMLRLPVPPFTMMGQRRKDRIMFASFRYDGERKQLVAADGAALYAKFPFMCAGIVAFDILIANRDRIRRNIKVDKPQDPTRYYIIDHERSLLFLYPGDGCAQLDAMSERLGLTDGTVSSNDTHCLVGELKSGDDLADWIARIKDIPNWFFDEVCDSVPKFAITTKEREAVRSFLKSRRDRLSELVTANQNRFQKIKQWPLYL